jgi:uncharacterized protein YcfL
MKKILFLLTLIALAATGCQSMNTNTTSQSQAHQVDWTRGGGAIGLP